MAVNSKRVNLENIEVEGTKRTEERVNSTSKTSTGADMGMNFFGGFIRPNMVSDYVRQFKEGIVEAVKDQDLFDLKLLAFDNQSNAQGWAYSFVIVAGTRGDTNDVYYMPFLLEGTGREPVAIGTMLETDPRTGLVRVKDPSLLFTPSDYFNNIIIGEIEKSLKVSYPGKTIKYIDGEIVPHNAEMSAVAPYAAVDAIGGMWIMYSKSKGVYKDLEIDKILAPNTSAYADVTLNSGAGINKLGRVSAIDYIVKLSTKKQEQKQMIPGITDQVTQLGSISGYVEEGIVAETDFTGKQKFKALPVLITSEVDTQYPTLGFTLLNLVNTAVLNQQNVLLDLLYNKNNSGALNFLCNLEGAEGFGSIVNIKDKKYTYEKGLMYLSKLFTNRAAIAFETELNGREFFKVSPFAALINPSTWAKANEFIVQTAETLVSRPFSNRVVFRYAIEVPVGEWVDNNGITRDLREIDLATVISLTKDINIIHKWISSNEDPKVSNVDPYLTKIEVYNKLGLNARIHNKAVRVYLDPNFMAELIKGINELRFNPILNTNTNFTNFADLSTITTSSIAASMLNSSIGATPGFGGGYQYNNYGYVNSGFYY